MSATAGQCDAYIQRAHAVSCGRCRQWLGHRARARFFGIRIGARRGGERRGRRPCPQRTQRPVQTVANYDECRCARVVSDSACGPTADRFKLQHSGGHSVPNRASRACCLKAEKVACKHGGGRFQSDAWSSSVSIFSQSRFPVAARARNDAKLDGSLLVGASSQSAPAVALGVFLTGVDV